MFWSSLINNDCENKAVSIVTHLHESQIVKKLHSFTYTIEEKDMIEIKWPDETITTHRVFEHSDILGIFIDIHEVRLSIPLTKLVGKVEVRLLFK